MFRRSCRRSSSMSGAGQILGANDRACHRPARVAVRDLGLPVWGLSPSATPGGEHYGEYGVKLLGSLGHPAGR